MAHKCGVHLFMLQEDRIEMAVLVGGVTVGGVMVRVMVLQNSG